MRNDVGHYRGDEMSGLTRIGGIAAIVVGLLVAVPASAQDPDEVEIRVEDLGSGIYAIYAAGGAIGLSVGEDGIYLIDDQYAPLSERLMETIAGISDQPIRYLLNTHWHGDHTGGNEAFGATGSVIISHDNVRLRMENGLEEDWFGRVVEPASDGALPVITVSEDATFHFNGQEVRLIHSPAAHTDGDMIVHFVEANVLHMGDTFFNGNYPYVDVISGGSTDGMIDALALGLSLSDEETAIIAGHGPLGTRADLQAAHDMLVDVRRRVQYSIVEGMTEDEAVATNMLDSHNEDWDWRFITAERMIRLTYQSLTD